MIFFFNSRIKKNKNKKHIKMILLYVYQYFAAYLKFSILNKIIKWLLFKR